jgi:hypothetical protein
MKIAARWVVLEVVSLVVGGAIGWTAGCSGGNAEILYSADGGVVFSPDGSSALGTDAHATGGACVACVTSATCGTGACAQFQSDTFCAPSCAAGEGLGGCAAGTTCSIESAYNGTQVSVCVPDNNACGTPVGSVPPGSGSGSGLSGSGSGTSAPPPTCVPSSGGGNCAGYAAPGTAAGCGGCGSSGSTTCQANGCYGGWYCDLASTTCHAPPAGCTGSGGGTTCPDAGSGGTGSGSGTGSGGTTAPPRGNGGPKRRIGLVLTLRNRR